MARGCRFRIARPDDRGCELRAIVATGASHCAPARAAAWSSTAVLAVASSWGVVVGGQGVQSCKSEPHEN